jgi:glycosyltransferase involved in cell wall biosynthesis
MNPESPLISVIIPNFNRGDLLPGTLGSLLRQDYPFWEAIVVDDGSTDNSERVTGNFAQTDSRISFIKRDHGPAGAPTCRNIGISRSKGDFLIFLDSDDLLSTTALSQRAGTMKKYPGLDFWVFPILMFRNNPADASLLWNIDNGQPDLHRFLILDAPWQTSGPIWRKEAVLKIGGFTEGLACWQDVDFHLKALISGLRGMKYYQLPPDVFYRQHETQSISQGEISSPAKLSSRQQIFFSHSDSLLPKMTSELRNDLGLLGGNIAIGAAKALNNKIAGSVISYGVHHRIFSFSVALKLRMILVFYMLRINRIPILGGLINGMTQKYRQDSNIGKHRYNANPRDGK